MFSYLLIIGFPLLHVLPSISLCPSFKIQLKCPLLYEVFSNSLVQKSSFPLIHIHSTLSLPVLISFYIVLKFCIFTFLSHQTRGNLVARAMSSTSPTPHPFHSTDHISQEVPDKNASTKLPDAIFFLNYHVCKSSN